MEAVTVAIGISVETQLGSDKEEKEDEEDVDEETADIKRPDLIRAISIAFCGTILIASNIAPTEEVIVIAMESEVYKILIMALLSIGIGGAVLYYINFTGTEQITIKSGQHIKALAATLIMYAIALLSSAFML